MFAFLNLEVYFLLLPPNFPGQINTILLLICCDSPLLLLRCLMLFTFPVGSPPQSNGKLPHCHEGAALENTACGWTDDVRV